MAPNKTIAAVIPAFNEARSIGEVVSNVSKYAVTFVIDDGSTDTTGAIAKENGANVIRHQSNSGYEEAIITGFKAVYESGFKYVITIDADGQHNPEVINKFIKELENGADIVVGNRDKLQRIGEYAFAFIGKRIWGINDPLCGMKAYKVEKLFNNGLRPKYDSVGTIFAISAAKNGNKITNINILTKNRGDRSRFGAGWSANKKILTALLRAI